MSEKACCSKRSCCQSNTAGVPAPEVNYTISKQYPGCEKWVTGVMSILNSKVPQVSTLLNFEDYLGIWKVRLGIGRMEYTIEPGLYCVGVPDATSSILVTANYKLSFDMLRKELADINAWILVLDTNGINVWCAAGKGTFGTDELIGRINGLNLKAIVSHRVVVLPQLGAPGVKAHEVQKQTGFKVVYGPVRAGDVKVFITSGMKASKEMRTVKFSFIDRLVLTPIELTAALKPALIIFGILFVLNSINFGNYGLVDIYAFTGAILAGCVITPALLPWIPGRAFSFKGFLLGFTWASAVNLVNMQSWPAIPVYGCLKAIAYMLILPSITAYGAMNFTGCSTYTSLSGVNKEMKIALPVMIISTFIGIILLVIDSILRL